MSAESLLEKLKSHGGLCSYRSLSFGPYVGITPDEYDVIINSSDCSFSDIPISITKRSGVEMGVIEGESSGIKKVKDVLHSNGFKEEPGLVSFRRKSR